MTRHTDTAVLHGLPFDLLRRAMLDRAETCQLTVHRDAPGGLTLGTAYGDLRLAPDPAGCRIALSAARADHLQTLRDTLVHHAGELAPDAAEALRWSSGAAAAKLPANARLMRVETAQPLDCGFIRVTLTGDVSRFEDGAIHFRLGLPPEGRAPVWPAIGANGATQWPRGEDALHLPVYTARSARDGRLVFDIFRHEGGRATLWADSVAPGTEVLIAGPGGGGCRIDGPIAGHADDTAFPAIARILEACPGLTGVVNLYPSSAQTARYPFPEHPGVALVMHPRKADTMADAACDALDQATFPWFAGERQQADRLRQAWKTAGGSAKAAYIAAFWQG